MSHKMDDETLPPGTERFYDICGWNRWLESDGAVLIRAVATDGTEVWLMRGPDGAHEVRVENPDGTHRAYGGDPARGRFEAFLATYESLFDGVDSPRRAEDTEPTR